MQLRRELLLTLLELRLDGPILDRLERANLSLAFNDESQRNCLNATRGNPFLDRLPENGARLVADESIEHPSRLLCFDFSFVDLPSIRDRTLHGVFRDLMKE